MKLEKITLEFVGIDDWNRPVFKMPNTKMFFGSTDKLFDWDDTEEIVLEKLQIDDLCYFGNHFNCEPLGGTYLEKGKEIKMKSGKIIELVLPNKQENINGK